MLSSVFAEANGLRCALHQKPTTSPMCVVLLRSRSFRNDCGALTNISGAHGKQERGHLVNVVIVSIRNGLEGRSLPSVGHQTEFSPECL